MKQSELIQCGSLVMPGNILDCPIPGIGLPPQCAELDFSGPNGADNERNGRMTIAHFAPPAFATIDNATRTIGIRALAHAVASIMLSWPLGSKARRCGSADPVSRHWEIPATGRFEAFRFGPGELTYRRYGFRPAMHAVWYTTFENSIASKWKWNGTADAIAKKSSMAYLIYLIPERWTTPP
jgi:hypothetical protein